MRVLFTLIFLFTLSLAYNQTQTFTTSGSFTVPAGVTSIFVECWGAGGAGGGAVGSSFRGLAGGGGGGGYSTGTINVMPGDIINYTVAPTTPGATNTPNNGGTSTFGSVSAAGGMGGECLIVTTAHLSGAGGAGGVGNTFSGGAGGSRSGYNGQTSGWTSGGGGGGAGTATNGGDAASGGAGTSNAGGIGGASLGGNGGNGVGVSSGSNGSTGLVVGGGGSGAYAAASTTQRTGGAGARGQIRITYTVLPIKIRSFNVNKIENTSFLNLITASETNNDYFTIERSGDGSTFDAIGEIKGAGNSTEEKHYEFTDENPLPGINYYRIKQTDFDGQHSYSEIRSVRHTGKGNVAISPRSTDGRLDISTDVESYDVAVYSSAGQEVARFNALAGHQTVNIEALQTGIYFVKVMSGTESETVRVVKY